MPPPVHLPSRAARAWELALKALTTASVVALAACAGAPNDGGSAARGGLSKQGYRTKLDGQGPQTPPAGFPKFIDHSVGQEEISMQAMGLVGVPYRWGGNTPAAGFDCSGLVRYVVDRAAQVDLPRTTGDMSREGVNISPSEVAPGDLIFFNTSGRAHSHVGIYVGDYRFVNAPSTGGTVRIDYVTNPYWAKRFDGIRRVAGRDTTPILDSPVTPSTPAPQSIMPPRALAAVPAPLPLPPAYDPIAGAIAQADRASVTKTGVTAVTMATAPATAPTPTPAPASATVFTRPAEAAQSVAQTPGAEDATDPIAHMISRGY